MSPVYLDHNATTAPTPEVVQAVLEGLQQAWANPSSQHGPGQRARQRLTDARARIAQGLGCQPAELVFTSGATEANHAALLGALARGRALGRQRLVLSAVEHAGLLALAERLRSEGTPVDLIPVNHHGQLDLARAQALMGPDVALLSVMAANNETGVLMPVAELAALARQHGLPFHCDATQAVGKQALRFDASGADLWSLSAHKLHGPKGVGALIIRKGLSWPAMLVGRQERGRRGGTENLPAILGFAVAVEQMQQQQAQALPRMTALRDRLEAGLRQLHPAVQLAGAGQPRLANTLSLRFGTLDAERVLMALERAGVIASSGAACSTGGTQPSHVLRAMGLGDDEARAGIRLSLGPHTTPEQVEQALAAARQALQPLLAELALAAA